MWWYYLQGLRHDLWSSLPPKAGRSIFAAVFDKVLHLIFNLIDSVFFQNFKMYVKFIYSENATKICEIFTLLLSYVVPVKSKVKISQNLVAFSEYISS
jgi:hypothetical protein